MQYLYSICIVSVHDPFFLPWVIESLQWCWENHGSMASWYIINSISGLSQKTSDLKATPKAVTFRGTLKIYHTVAILWSFLFHFFSIYHQQLKSGYRSTDLIIMPVNPFSGKFVKRISGSKSKPLPLHSCRKSFHQTVKAWVVQTC